MTEPEVVELIKQTIRDSLRIEVNHRSNDPEDPVQRLTVYLGDEEVASADLPACDCEYP